MSAPQKAKFIAKYDDGSEKMAVSYDTTSDALPCHIYVEQHSESWLYVDVDDVPQLCAFLRRARKAVLAIIAAGESA